MTLEVSSTLPQHTATPFAVKADENGKFPDYDLFDRTNLPNWAALDPNDIESKYTYGKKVQFTDGSNGTIYLDRTQWGRPEGVDLTVFPNAQVPGVFYSPRYRDFLDCEVSIRKMLIGLIKGTASRPNQG